MDYTQLTIEAPAQWEDVLTALLFSRGAPGVEVDDPSIIAAHLEAGDWDASIFDGQPLKTGRVILRALFSPKVPDSLYEDIAALGLEQGLLRMEAAPLPNQDWQQTWRLSFPTLLLGEKLAVMPYWRQDELPAGTIPLLVSPGLAFGTGDHATTALVAELLQTYITPGQRVLDLGCGSGILAISALKLGASAALAVDIDADCAASVSEHRSLNEISEKDLPFRCGDILNDEALQKDCLGFGADILLSNIVAGVIARLAGHGGQYLGAGGLWISSGILVSKEEMVTAALKEHGWEIVERCTRGEWVALVSRKPSLFEKSDTKTFKVYSFGCKVNQEEAEGLSALFMERGWLEADDADLYIINTCTVTQVADKKARGLIRRLRRLHPSAILAVTGCYAQTSAQQIAELVDVDIIAGLQERKKLPDLVEQHLRAGEKLLAVADISRNTEFQTIGASGRQKRARAYLKVEDGCGQFCHYCVIPYARGPVRSLPLAQAIAEAGQLLAAGHKELVLSGIHIGAYGEDLPAEEDLCSLIKGILSLADDFRLRLGSVEPQQFSPQLLQLFAEEPRLCSHVHIPLQAGCDTTLAAMNRRYTTAEYTALLNMLRSLRPGLAVTTDVMVGYPGESMEDFNASANFCKSMKFAGMHIFPYSQRHGTVAANLPQQVAQQEKAGRAAILGQLAQNLADQYALGFIGQKLQYLFEQELYKEKTHQPDKYIYAGHSSNYLPLLLAETPPPSELIDVFAADYRDGYLLCEIL